MSLSSLGNTLRSQVNFSSVGGMAGTVILGAAAEMGVRAVVDCFKLVSPKTRKQAADDLAKDIGGAIFYSLAAANLVPGSRIIGGLIFLGYSVYVQAGRDAINNDNARARKHNAEAEAEAKGNNGIVFLKTERCQNDDYYLARVVGFVVLRTLKLMWKVFKPVYEYVIFPLCEAIWKVVKVVFQAIGSVLGVLVNVPPIFLGIGLLLTAIGVYKGSGAFIRCAREFFPRAPAQIPA